MKYQRDDVLRAWLLSNPLNFTRFFFSALLGTKFIVGRHHKIVCDKLEEVLEGKTTRLIVNIAPRYSKTSLAVKNFIAMGLALNPAARFIHLSYSDMLAQDNSIAIKDIVTSEKYQSLFPARIRQGSDTRARWDTEQGGGVYATSMLGQITGFGAGAMDVPGEPYKFSGAIVIDDPIKPEDALSDLVRERVNRRFETTVRTRVNSRDTPIIIIMQRLHEHDLCGYLTQVERDRWEVVSQPCIWMDENGEEQPLWAFKHTLAELKEIEKISPFVFETQYMQHPRPIEGLMYSHFSTYIALPSERGLRKAYIDTADTGSDFLCAIFYDEHTTGCYVTDIIYTQSPMEYTEPLVAKAICQNATEKVIIESNNGGRGFRRNVEREVRARGCWKTHFIDLVQRANKQTRIFTHSAEVQNMVFFPQRWEERFPLYANAMKSYRREGTNLHDDAPDATTGVVECFKGERTKIDMERLAKMIY